MDILYATYTKNTPKKGNNDEESAALNEPRLAKNLLPITDSSTITIPTLLELVNIHYPDIMPEDVWKHFVHEARPIGILGGTALYSRENPHCSGASAAE